MATANPFDILGDNENDATHLIAAAVSAVSLQKPDSKPPKKAAASPAQPQPPPPKLPAKPLPPAQAVREAKSDAGAGRGRGRGLGGSRGFGRGRGEFRGYDQEAGGNEVAVGSRPSEEGESGRSSERRGRPRGSFRGGRRGGFRNGEVGEGEHPHRVFERRSGTGRGSEIKRDGAGRGNWGTATDEIAPETEEVVNEGERSVVPDKQPAEEDAADAGQEAPANVPEEEPEDKEMTLEEYEKVLEEKRKALVALKIEERIVVLDKDLKNMHQLSSKKENNDVFIKLGSDKEEKQKDAVEKAKKAVSINEFLKPADGKTYYNPAGRGRGRGRGSRGGYASGGGGYGGNTAPAPSIEDPGQFPSLGGK